jgi:NADH/NAD ratio-sensing transcriptional regulator Rex
MAVAALLDEETKVAGLPPRINDIPVLPLARLIHFVHSHNIKYAVLTVTDGHAQRVLDEAIISGIRGILNLSGHELKAPRACTLHSVSLCSEIENLIFFTQQKLKAVCQQR